MEWEYVAPRLSVSMFCSGGGWTGDLPPKALKLRFGVSFGYRFGIGFLFSMVPKMCKCKISYSALRVFRDGF